MLCGKSTCSCLRTYVHADLLILITLIEEYTQKVSIKMRLSWQSYTVKPRGQSLWLSLASWKPYLDYISACPQGLPVTLPHTYRIQRTDFLSACCMVHACAHILEYVHTAQQENSQLHPMKYAWPPANIYGLSIVSDDICVVLRNIDEP